MIQAGFFATRRSPFTGLRPTRRRRKESPDATRGHGVFRLTPKWREAIQPIASGDVLQGAAADCNSAGETHAWFDSRVAHHCRLKRELARVTEERDILKKATAYFARESQ
jgi:transposase-like protein